MSRGAKNPCLAPDVSRAGPVLRLFGGVPVRGHVWSLAPDRSRSAMAK